MKAVRLSRGPRVTADHDLEALVDELPHDDPWRAELRVLEPLSAYATTYRYPSPMGKRKSGPSNDEIVVWIKAIAGLNLEARAAHLRQARHPARPLLGTGDSDAGPRSKEAISVDEL